MLDELLNLINSLNNVETYDKQNILIDIYIFILENKEQLPPSTLLDIFAAISEWRDLTLCDGCDTYYDRHNYQADAKVLETLKQYASNQLYNLYSKGFENEETQLIEIDNWIIRNQWELDSWLSNIIFQYKNILENFNI